MFSSTRSTLAIAFAATIVAASPALGAPGGDDLRGENAAARSATLTQPGEFSDRRGENAVGVSEPGTPPADDQRSPDAREPVGGQGVAQPVAVEVIDPDGSGFDWTSAIIGLAGGLALAVLANGFRAPRGGPRCCGRGSHRGPSRRFSARSEPLTDHLLRASPIAVASLARGGVPRVAYGGDRRPAHCHTVSGAPRIARVP
jgi:hypothetical protein